ncbi:MAG: right-handed parallel beta-helix repeat-containing protein [Planctomycetales bacterium]|nr:right-handed parallel beta-helix repeat-containing protein [Planctomycetales bacterium]
MCTSSQILAVMITFVGAAFAAHADEPAAIATADATIIHVAPDGDDPQPGTADRPVRTPQRALDLVRERLAAGGSGSLVVEFAAGTYFLEQTLEFGQDDSPPAPATLTLRAAPNATVVLSGGVALSPWRVDGDCWEASLPADQEGPAFVRELFVADQRATRARFPNEGYLRVEESGEDRRTNFTASAADAQALAAAAGSELVFLHDWSTSRIRIANVDTAARRLTMTQPIGCAARHYAIDHFEPHPRFFVEDSATFLDAPGEWYFDAARRVIRYLPRSGETPVDAVAIVPRLASLMKLEGDGDADHPVRGIHFEGLTFAHCAWNLPPGGYAAGQACFHEDRSAEKSSPTRGMMPAAITADVVEGCEIRNCQFLHLGGCGLHLRQSCRNNRIEGCTVADVAGNGLMIGETFTRRAGGEPLADDSAFLLVCRGNVVENCHIRDCGRLFSGAIGIWIGISQDIRVANCRIHDLPYTGISLGWSWNTSVTACRRNVLEGNTIHDCLQVLSDGGGIYTLGRQPGTVLRANKIFAIPANQGRAESNGIFMDEGSSLILVEQNEIRDIDRSPIRFHQALEVTLRANRLFPRGEVPPFRYNSAKAETMTFEANVIEPVVD